MEALWEDLNPHVEEGEISPEIHALLDEREARVARGEATLHNWDDVKHLIGKQ